MADKLEQLKQKYQPVFRMMEQQQVRLQNVNMQGDKLFIRGEAPSQDAKNKVWDQIKMVDPQYSDLTADITVAQQAASAGAAHAAQAGQSSQGMSGGAQTYTVQAGDTLSKIAQKYYGDASHYRKIFEANQDQLKDPNMIKPGQRLVIPQ
ncbi:MAG: LysM peptidoglycan-binding domain-containing protein [Acidobacteriota bacterium]